MVDLDKLKEEISALGEKIKSLKTSGGSKDDIDGAVKELLAAKKLYADNNNGIGADGKPYEEPMTKAQKKAKAKAEKEAAAAAAAAAGGGGGGGGDVAAGAGTAKQTQDPNSVNAQKKAAKKAAKKAQKEAMKEGGGPPAAAAAGAGAGADTLQPGKLAGSPAANNNAAILGVPAVQTAKAAPAPAMTKRTPILPQGAVRVNPGQIVMNPNVPLTDRPLVTVTLAVLTNTVNDWHLVSDHRSRHAMLCGPSDGTIVTGDRSMAKYFLRNLESSFSSELLPQDDVGIETSIDAWVDYASSLSLLDPGQVVKAVAMTLQHALVNQTYLVGHSMTLADLCLFSSLGFPTQASDLATVLNRLPEHAAAARRWITMMAAHPALQEATQLCVGIANNAEAVFDLTKPPMEPLVTGMNPLEGAVAGRVVTRFPPEPSGYLHIGHAKAVLLNDYYARRYQGRLILRFDDTNPSKEKEEFQESIVGDLAKLGVKPDMVTYSSDYFEATTGYAKILIQKGLAFMDDTPQEQMKAERAERQDSRHRNQSPEEALKYFDLMCSGDEAGASWCLRAKIDMKSDNGTLRDPVLYRQNLTPHHRSGTKFKAYPTYDMACPIVDSIEGVTHPLRTTEYNDRDAQYQWILKALGLRRPRNHAFSRVNFEFTVLSKRKLTWFVENGYVTGWDDPRFPTVRGVVRRGIDIDALRAFMYAQGASRNVVNMVWHTFWANNKKEIDSKAKRYMAIDRQKYARLTITNGPKESEHAYKETSFHPKDPSMGTRAMRVSENVLLETVDVEGLKVEEEIVLLRWGVFKITKVEGGLEAEYVPDGDFKKAGRKLSWLADVKTNCPVVLFEYDHLVTKAKLEETDNFQDHITPTTMASTEVVGDAGLKTLPEHTVIQLERRGFFRVDRPYMSKEKPLRLIMIPDGKSKSMAGLEGKLAHH